MKIETHKGSENDYAANIRTRGDTLFYPLVGLPENNDTDTKPEEPFDRLSGGVCGDGNGISTPQKGRPNPCNHRLRIGGHRYGDCFFPYCFEGSNRCSSPCRPYAGYRGGNYRKPRKKHLKSQQE